MFPSLANAEMYKWIDDQGRVHYGDKPKNKTTAIHVKTKQKPLTKSVKPTSTSKSKAKKSAQAADLGHEQWYQEQLEKAKNMSDEDIMQHHAEVMRKQEENRQRILVRMDEDQERYERESAERQKEFEAMQEEREEAQRRLMEELQNPSVAGRNSKGGKYYVNEDNILIAPDGKRASYHSDYLDANGNPVDARGQLLDHKGKTIYDHAYNERKRKKFENTQKRKERLRKKTAKEARQMQMRRQESLNRQY